MRRSIALAAIAAVVIPCTAQGQYFGQNKVQYRNFNFQVLQTEHFDVYFYGNRDAALDAARMAERGYARLARVLNHEWRERKPLVVYLSHSDFQQTNTTSGDLGEGTGGFTEFFKHRIVLPWTGSYADFEHVLQHELVHAFQYDVYSRGRIGGGFQALSQASPPLWFMEGMAEYLSVGPLDAHTAMWMRDAALEGRIPTIEQLTFDPRFFPYRFGHALFAYIGQKWGDETIGAILQGSVNAGIERSFQRVLGLNFEQLSDEWRDAVQTTYLPRVADHQRPRRFARPVLTERLSGGTLHASPQISPDGRRIVYLSERNFFFVDLHLADAESGRHIKRLIRSAFSADFESLRFIYSTGSWSPDGREYAFASKSGDRDVINILDVDRGRVRNVIRPSDVGGITNPSFSPDGRRLAFTGQAGGWSDLYVVDRNGGNLRRLTDDRYADLQPSWSPDGRAVAFATDRGPDTDFSILRFGNLRIAVYWLDGDSITVLPGMDDGKNTNPVWAPDGRSLAFVSDRSGIDNVFLYDLQDSRIYQITNIYSGVSGITDLSPAISWAREADRLVFTAYENGDYNVYALDNPRGLKREPYQGDPSAWVVLANASAQPLRRDFSSGRVRRPAPPAHTLDAAVPAPAATPSGASIYRSGGTLRPSDATVLRPDSAPAPVSIAALLDSVTLALPDTQEFLTRPYRVRFTADLVSRPTIGYTRDNFGRGFFGGTAVQLSDILGNHVLTFSGAVNGRISEAQLFAAYANLSHRWNYAFGLAQEPLFYYGSSSREILPQADVVRQQLRRYVFRTAFAETYYPFNRFRRLELGTRLTSINQATLNLVTFYDPSTRQALAGYDSISNEGNFTYLQPSAALVYDNTQFGYTSSLFGQRYRFEVAQSMGDWKFTQVVLDYRRYVMLGAPFFTFATRLMTFGRLGPDEARFPFFLGSTELIRGYTFGSFRDGECRFSTTCTALDQLIGSRVAVANAEIRFPLIRTLALGILPVGFPPIEGALFFDAGLAWDGDSDVRWSQPARSSTVSSVTSNTRAPVTSYGVGIRANILGFLILRVDYAVPRQRPGRGGYWMVSLGPPF